MEYSPQVFAVCDWITNERLMMEFIRSEIKHRIGDRTTGTFTLDIQLQKLDSQQ